MKYINKKRYKISLILSLCLTLSLLSLKGYADPGKDESGKGRSHKRSHQRVAVHHPRSIQIPPGHYPPPGECRLWYPDRPAGQQPPPIPCNQLRPVSRSFILYEGKAWDVDFDWENYARQKRGTVPRLITELIFKR